MQYFAVGMLSMLGMIGTTHAKVDISQLSAYKVAEHEYVAYEGSNGVSKIAGNTLFKEGKEGNTLYHVDDQGITFKRQYPKSHFVEPTNIVVEYELSDDGKKLLSIDKHNEIAKIWQINTDFSLTLVSEINFNTPPEAMTFVELDFQNGHYILYGQTEENTFVRTVFYWDQANDRFSQQSRLTLNNPTPTHEITFHSYPEQGLMVAISPEKLYLYQESAQGFELKLEQDFEFVSHNRIVTKLDTINNRLLVHYWKETITLELGANNKVTAVTTLPHESLFGLNITVHDLHPTEDQLIAHTLGCLHTLNLSDTNTYTATELECNPAIYDIRDISADGNKLLMPGRGLTVADISNIDDVELINRPREQGRVKTAGNGEVNLPLGEHSSLNYNRILLTHTHLTPEFGQTFVSDNPLAQDPIAECRYDCQAWLALGKEVVALNGDQFIRYNVEGDEETLHSTSGTLTVADDLPLERWYKAIALNDTDFMLTDGISMFVFTRTEAGFAHKFTQPLETQIEFGFYGYSPVDFIPQNNQLHLFDRDNKQLARYDYTGNALTYATAVPFGPLDSGALSERYLATYMLNGHLIVETIRGYLDEKSIKFLKIEDSTLIEEASLPGALLAPPHALSAEQMALFIDQGDDKVYVFDASVDDHLIEVGDYSGYDGSYTAKDQLLHFYGQGSVFVGEALKPLSDTLDITTLQGVEAEFDLNEIFNASLQGKLTFSAENLPLGLTLSEQGIMHFDGTELYDTTIEIDVMDSHQRTVTFSVLNSYVPGPQAIDSLLIEVTQNESHTVDLKTLVTDALAVAVNGVAGDMTLSDSTLTITFTEPGEYQLPFSAVNVQGAITTHILQFDVSEQVSDQGDDSDAEKNPDDGEQDSGNGDSDGGETETKTDENTTSNTGNASSTTNTASPAKSEGGSGGSMAWLLMAMALLLPARSRSRKMR
ncbi:hypothetical protein [Pseudoalteromonas ardens]|uniref:Uncharacterized protein n=1 Tax=Pseudoalteromonas rubra TaxID=43658 RepID=A0A0L0ENH5_9GAMM|nr:hypothetical protein [Pseudoalteromonas sp. R96]KNC66037.1 hypothetical protein AC626_19430 [Pseudoalteromonas rubra]MDK1310332.1 hypothetical protein [Pseudoalteromonas sp. R96]